MGKSCVKFLCEILAGKSCRKWRRGKSQFKKGSDWWKFSIWNRVMGANQSGSRSGKSCGKILREILVEIGVGEKANLRNSCRKILREIVAGKSCGKILWEILAGNLAENLAGKYSGKSCRKILWENLVGNSCGKILWEILLDIPHTNSKIYNSSRSTLFSLVNFKNSFLKLILN